MFAGFDQIVKDIWTGIVPRLVWTTINDAWVVHLGRWCWTSRWSGFTIPFVFQYQHFDMSEQSFRTDMEASNTWHIPHKISIQGRYKWDNIREIVIQKGYDSLDELITAFIEEQVMDLMKSGADLESMNAELLRRVKREYEGLVLWLSLRINPVFTLPISKGE